MTQRNHRADDLPAAERAAVAGEVVRRIMHVSSALRHHIDLDLARLGLTPAAARALQQLDPDLPVPARDLAGRLGCDRSNVTGLADRLERAGLVRRRTDPADRRLKGLVVTEAGRRMRDEVDRVTSESRLLDGLTAAELDQLRALLWRISDGGCPEQGCDGPDVPPDGADTAPADPGGPVDAAR